VNIIITLSKTKKIFFLFWFQKNRRIKEEIEELNIKCSDIKKLIDIISFIEMLKGKISKKDKDFLSFLL
jgi:hypothetical protein